MLIKSENDATVWMQHTAQAREGLDTESEAACDVIVDNIVPENLAH